MKNLQENYTELTELLNMRIEKIEKYGIEKYLKISNKEIGCQYPQEQEILLIEQRIEGIIQMNNLTNTEDKTLAILKVLNTNDKTHSTRQKINILTDIIEMLKQGAKNA